jgi:hypothetical protein
MLGTWLTSVVGAALLAFSCGAMNRKGAVEKLLNVSGLILCYASRLTSPGEIVALT